MILSIRHRILIPFLFINLFLTFVALFVSIEFINSHFENKLYTSAIQKEAKLEYLFDQIITESYLASPRECVDYPRQPSRLNIGPGSL